MEVYIDNMLVKSLNEQDHVTHLQECFRRLNMHNMKLNQAKCRLAVALGEFLGYLVTYRGIKANPKNNQRPDQNGFPEIQARSEKINRESRGTQSIHFTINGQVLADFLVKLPAEDLKNKEPDSTWLLHIDGSSSKQGAVIGIRLTSPTGEIIEQSFRLDFHASNNEADYEALVAGLRLAHGLKIHNIQTYCDSQIVANQYNITRDERMDAYLKIVQDLAQYFDHFLLTRIPHSENSHADALAALASSSDMGLKKLIPAKFIQHPSIRSPIVANLIRAQENDIEENLEQPEYGCDKSGLEMIQAYIVDRTLPAEKWEACKIRTQVARYVSVDMEIYKWKFSEPLMTCGRR
ncbi:hypothetical protein N665_0142s0009 [Sinapis alba]|nr:hypothetical protein N665_0142s0009 [Sinapis alba]